MEELKELFKKIGYTENEFDEIINAYSSKTFKTETLMKRVKENYNFFISLGYTREEIIKMTKGNPWC